MKKIYVGDLLNDLNKHVRPLSVIRIGKQNSKPKLLRVVFESTDALFSVLKNKILLHSLPNRKDAWITTDLTSYQRKILSSLKKKHAIALILFLEIKPGLSSILMDHLRWLREKTNQLLKYS